MSTNIGLSTSNLNTFDIDRKISSIDTSSANKKATEGPDSSKVNQVKQDVDAAYDKVNVKELSKEEEAKSLTEAIEVVSDFINRPLQNVNFLQDESSGKTIIKVFDTHSKELIKQFPSDEVIEMAKKVRSLQMEIGEKTGMLVDHEV